jgi:hypothetical protein
MASGESIIAGPVVDFVAAYGAEIYGARGIAAAVANAPAVTDVTYHDSSYRAPHAEDVPTVYAAVRQPAPEVRRNRPGDRLQRAAWAILSTTGAVE